MNVFVDFLGYSPNVNYLLIEKINDDPRQKYNSWIYSHWDLREIGRKIDKEKWNLVPNPRFQTSAGHLELVKEIQERIKIDG